MAKICGVYMLTNKVNGKRYIGSSNNVISRAHQHFGKQCREKYGDKNPFYADIVEYGRVAFIFEILEECSPDEKIERERYWWSKLRPEYNQIEPCDQPFLDPYVIAKKDAAQSTQGHREAMLRSHRSDQCRRKCREAQRGRMRACAAIDDSGKAHRFECMSDGANWICEIRGGHRPTIVNHIRRAIDVGGNAYGYRWMEVVPNGENNRQR